MLPGTERLEYIILLIMELQKTVNRKDIPDYYSFKTFCRF